MSRPPVYAGMKPAIAYVIVMLAGIAPAAPRFAREFAPTEPWTRPQEAPRRADLCLNGSWQFQPVPLPSGYQRNQGTTPELPPPAPDRWERTPIRIPSPWNVNDWGNGRNVGPGTAHPYWPDSVYYPSYPPAWNGAEMGWLRRSFRVPADWVDKRVILHFEAVAGDCQVLVNGRKAGEHFDRFLPFQLDVTSLVKPDADNELLVGVRHHRLFNTSHQQYRSFRTPYPPGSELERIVGIWQDVYLLGLPKVRVTDAFIRPLVDQDTLRAVVIVRNDSDQPMDVTVAGDVHPWVNQAGAGVLDAPEPKWKLDEAVLNLAPARLNIEPGKTATLILEAKVGSRLELWSPASPNLHALLLSVSGGGQVVDRHFTRFGWRQFILSGRDLLLNGQKIQLFGDLSHPFGPFMMSRRFAWSWYTMIKDFGGNAVRPHAQPYPRLYLDLADEMGLCVLDETALFGSSIQLDFHDGLAWKRYTEHYDALILRDRNHPSVLGWSFGNELFAIFEYNRVSKPDADSYYAKLAQLGLRARQLDPTRPWVSCDGDEDLRGTLPIWSKHFGHNLHALPDIQKPMMVGESGGTYYATPGQLAAFNGDRSYENYAGRNEALAIDLYQNVAKVARPRLAYYSPSEMVWFGIEHLPLGFNDFTRLPTLDDGVLFAAYVEGKPGMQPERIPPYVTTLNPGFDPALPLYKPLAMFEAMKAALAPDGPRPCPWDRIPAPTAVAPAPKPTIAKVAFAGDADGKLRRRLAAWGVPLVDDDAAMLIVDAAQPITDALRKRIDAVHQGGGSVLILIRQMPRDPEALRALLPADTRLVARTATSLVPSRHDSRVAGLSLADLYFAEIEGDRQVIKCGIDGGILQRSTILLRAADTDWSLFNRAPEVAKCGAVVMYEQQRKPSGAAVVEVAQGPGRTLLCTIDHELASPPHTILWRQLLTRLGVQLNEPRATWIVPIATADEQGAAWRYTTDAPPAAWNQPDFDDSAWKSGRAGFGTDVPGSKPRTPWTTTDIWLRREFDLPAGASPDLSLVLHHDEDVEVFLNGTRIHQRTGHLTAYEPVELSADARKAFRRGRNVLAAHCRQTVGGQYIDVGLAEGFIAPSPAKGPGGHDLLLDGPRQK